MMSSTAQFLRRATLAETARISWALIFNLFRSLSEPVGERSVYASRITCRSQNEMVWEDISRLVCCSDRKRRVLSPLSLLVLRI